MSTADRRGMLDRDDPNLSVRAQCAMLGLCRSGVYRQRAANDDDDLALMRRIDKLFLQHPFLGSRRMVSSDIRNWTHFVMLMRLQQVAQRPSAEGRCAAFRGAGSCPPGW